MKKKTNSNIPVKELIKVKLKSEVNYLLYLPSDYFKSGKKYPLVMFLHGMGERGSDLNKVKIHGIPKLIDEGKEFPFIVVSPQCPENDIWSSSKRIEILNALLESILKEYRVKRRRVYLTGLSMGGFGILSLASCYPEKFAAIAPVCGGSSLITSWNIGKKMPVWAFHGAKDTIVKPSESKRLIKTLKQFNNKKLKLTIYPDADHDSWTETYKNPKLYEWFLKHKKKKK